jgi:hypothetical protein
MNGRPHEPATHPLRNLQATRALAEPAGSASQRDGDVRKHKRNVCKAMAAWIAERHRVEPFFPVAWFRLRSPRCPLRFTEAPMLPEIGRIESFRFVESVFGKT